MQNLSIIATILRKVADMLREMRVIQSTQQPMPTPDPTPKANPDLLHAFCMAIQVYEGYIVPGGRDGAGNIYPSGSSAYRNKNPGNLRCNAHDRANWNMLAIGCTTDNFCIFPTYEIGFQALVNVTLHVARGLSDVYNLQARNLWKLENGGELTLPEYFVIRDPASDGNIPSHFAAFVAKQIGVDINTFRMKQLV